MSGRSRVDYVFNDPNIAHVKRRRKKIKRAFDTNTIILSKDSFLYNKPFQIFSLQVLLIENTHPYCFQFNGIH